MSAHTGIRYFGPPFRAFPQRLLSSLCVVARRAIALSEHSEVLLSDWGDGRAVRQRFRFTQGVRAHMAAVLDTEHLYRLRSSRPPVPASQQPHSGWNKQAAHNRRIKEDRNTDAQPQFFGGDQLREGEGTGNNDEKQGGTRDDTSRFLQTQGHRRRILPAAVPLFAYARKQKHLIIHA